MGNAPSAPPAQHSPTSPRVSQSTPTQNKNHFPRREAPPSPTATRTSTKPPPAPVTPTTKSTPTTSTTTATTSTTSTPPPSDAGTASPSLRPNRKSIDLPGLNTFAPAPAALPHSRLGSRIVERGRQWAHRAGAGHPSHHNANGSYVNGNGAHHGGGVGGSGYGAGSRGGMRGGTPPRSAAIAIPIPGRRGEGEAVEEEETGYGYHAREGIARRKKEEKEREERGRGRSPTRSRSRPARPAHPSHPSHNNLRAPSPSRSHSLSPSHSHSRSNSRSRGSPSRDRGSSRGSPSRSDDRGRRGSPSRGRTSPSRSDGRSDDRYSRYTDDESGASAREGGRGRDGREAPHPSPNNREAERERERARWEALYGSGLGGPAKAPQSAYAREVVYSTIPLTIGASALIGAGEGDGYEEGEEGRGEAVKAVVDEIVGSPPAPPPPLTPVPITWRAPAAEVFLIRAGDDDWRGRRAMEREREREGDGLPTGPFTTTIHLPPGTHHFRFIVDGQTLVAPATEIPNAVDDQGFIANYVAVPGPVGTTTPNTTSATTSASAAVAAAASSKASSAATSATVSPSASTGGRNKRRRPSLPVHPDGSFWARSSAGGSSEDLRLAERVGMSGGSRAKGWTSEIPEALVNAAAQEEAWLDAQAQYQQHAQAQHAAGGGARDASRGRHIVLNGFVPEPSIPPAPRLPRHLERLILNRPSPGVVVPRVATGAGGSGSSMNAVGGSAPSPALRVTTASGTDVSVPMMSFTSASGAGASGSNANGSSHHSHSHSGDRPNAATHPQFGNLPAPAKGVPGSPGSGGGTPLIADDPSVLQTPSHAVLYHLCTSSIRDKMIAVGASTRYRQKYLTTVYYKPAVPSSREESV